jgi:sulfate transport system permease protein
VTLPFIVRTVQPVLLELEHEVEEAAASLGANRLTTFWLVILPSLAPAVTSGAALSFCRAISEYGSLVLLSGNLPYSTEVASVRIMSSIEGRQADRSGSSGLNLAGRRTDRDRRARSNLPEGSPLCMTLLLTA